MQFVRYPLLVVLVATVVVAPSATQATAQTIVYSNDFSTSVGSEWSTNAGILATPSGEQVLGSDTTGAPEPVGSETLALTLTGLPAHSRLALSVDLYTLRSWDGNSPDFGPDNWDFDATGTASEQELITDEVGGSLLVRDLLVKDYPIFLRLAG